MLENSNYVVTNYVSSFSTNSARFSKFDSRNVILFQIKVSGRNIKETSLVRYFIKVTAHLSFTPLIEFIKYRSRKYLTKIQLYVLLI